MNPDEIKKRVRDSYGEIAKGTKSSCCSSTSCCSGVEFAQDISKDIGYSEQELKSVPEGANLGLGCGNPIALAALKPGETVLDLGSGAGFDCFLAAQKVGQSGKVIGVDMTQDMIDKARENASKANYTNVEFRLGEIENLPVADNFVDVLISNCVINLSPDKSRVFEEAYRVLKPAGRLMISDIVLLAELPDFIKNSIAAYIGCLSGAVKKDEYIDGIERAGFHKVKIIEETFFPVEFMLNDPTVQAIIENNNLTTEKLNDIAESVRSIKVHGIK